MEATLAAKTRDERGKNEVRRLREAGHLPAVVYGGEAKDTVAVSVDPVTLLRILHSDSGVNTLIDLQLDGSELGQVLVKDFQLDPITSKLLHVDFYRLAMDKAIIVTVPVTLVGEPAGVKTDGGLLDFVTREVQLECMPAEIPEHIEVDVTDLNIGDGVRLRQVVEGASWTPVSELDTLLAHVTPPKVEEEPEEEDMASDEVAVAEGEGGEPELAKKGKGKDEGDKTAGGGDT